MSLSRMSRDERRNHLLDTAWRLISEKGVEAQTLAEVAKLGGVSKPVAYNHFGTRSAPLCALYERYYSDPISSVEIALTSHSVLEAAATTIVSSYLKCVFESGTVAAALSGAMSGASELEAMKQDCDDRYHTLCKMALEARSGRVPKPIAHIGFLGAAASISQQVVLGRTTSDEACRFQTALLTAHVDIGERPDIVTLSRCLQSCLPRGRPLD